MTFTYKFLKDGRKKFVDLDDICEGQTCFLIGGAPSLKDENLDLLRAPGIATMAINNAATLVKPTFWIGSDQPRCYARQILYDPSFMKFINWGKRDSLVDDVWWAKYPNTYAYSSVDDFTIHNFLHRSNHLVWWKNTWFAALQLLYRLGFRRVFTIGADFQIETNSQYAWETKIADEFIFKNKRLYKKTVNTMEELDEHFIQHDFHVLNCSPKSALRNKFGFTPLESAVEFATSHVPQDKTITLPHSHDHK